MLAVVAGAFGVRALLRRRARGAAPPVDELRAKLAESRTAGASAAPAPPEESEPVDEVDARRADVHERARRSIDELST